MQKGKYWLQFIRRYEIFYYILVVFINKPRKYKQIQKVDQTVVIYSQWKGMGKLSFPFFFGRAKLNYSISIICYRCLYPSIIALETASYWKRNTTVFLESHPKLH